MPMIKLKEQGFYGYEYKTKIKVRDINYGGHLGNDAVAGLLHEARLEMLGAKGFSELDLGDGKTGMIMADLVMNYKAEGHLNDEITVACAVGEISGIGFRIFYKITRGGTLLVLAESGLAAFDYQEKQIAEIPRAFQEAFE